MIDFQSLVDGGAASGSASFEQVEELRKALDSGGYGTDMSTLTGGAALRIQSLDTTMQATIQSEENFVLWNKIPKTKPGAIVDEWTDQSDVGGFLGGTTNTEAGIIQDETGDYARKVGQVKFMMTRRQVTVVQNLQNTIVSSVAVEQRNGALKLCSDAEYMMFSGDSRAVPTEFDGFVSQMEQAIALGECDPDRIIDAGGNQLTNIGAIASATASIAGYGSFGRATDIFWPQKVQADMDAGLDPAFRVALDNSPNSISYGTRVRALRTSNGDLATNQDVFIPDETMQMPFEAKPKLAVIAARQIGLKPANVTAAVATNISSLFTQPTAGLYYYLICGVNAAGASMGFGTAQVAVGAGQAVTLTIAQSMTGLETGYIIYRSRLNGTNAPTDVRMMKRIGRTGASTTFVDYNRELPGSCKAFITDLRPQDTSVVWRQFMPMIKFPLYPTASMIIPWAQALFGYLRISKTKHQTIVKNIVPNGALWKPFGPPPPTIITA